MKRIPLRNKDKKVVAYTIVDDIDFKKFGKLRWFLKKDGYACKNTPKIKGICTIVLLHRLITKCPKGLEVDHRNGKPLDNRRSNLRICTHSENLKNMRKPKDNLSGIKGVCWDKRINKWFSRIMVNGKTIYGGSFKTMKEAAQRYAELSAKYHGEFGRLS